ncbi:BglG family transcription antiterminator [Shouchella clausii]|uniref:BglG family transcription antiterminator n=2 Tax=Shouchella clausii TaxID=79880 RepID=UPI000BA6C8F9|nr:PTS sugar transporter subunit IIA [Shouchella clausii]MEB5479217.1 PTS sugar transporter subunit IIA [Shouchella clausii]PAD14641.1 hypothetical protein CHH74_08390 [Shouchella clausii]
MELLSSRQKELLERLLVERDYLSLQQIKDMYQLSPRTIRQDLLDIEEWLLEVGSDINMERSRKFGARLLVNDEQEQLILKALHKSRDFMTQAERWKDMQRRLLLEPSVLVNELYECYQISQNTLKNDINRMKQQLADYELEIRRENRKISLKGSERHKRMLFMDLLKDLVPEETALPLFVTAQASPVLSNDRLLSLCSLGEVATLINQIESAEGDKFADESKYELFLACVAQICRVKKRGRIQLSIDHDLRLLAQRPYWHLHEPFARLLGVKCRSDPFFHELAYLSMYVLGARRLSSSKGTVPIYESTARTIVTKFEQMNQTKIERREEVIAGLAIHLKSALYRLKYATMIENPHHDQLEIEYDAYLKQVQAILLSSPELGLAELNKHEIGFIAIHLCTGLMKNTLVRVKRVAIVCSSGVGTSMMLERSVRQLFPQVSIIGQYSVQEAHLIKEEEADLLITTVPFTARMAVPWIKVTPIMRREEVQYLEERLGVPAAVNRTDLDVMDTVKAVVELVKNHVPMQKEKPLYQDLYRFFAGYSKESGSITALTAKSCIHLQAPYSNWRDCIDTLTKSLVANGVVERSYGDEIMKAVDTGSHPFIVSPGVAFPHLRSKAVNRCGFAWMTLKEPILFGGSGEQVWWIVLLAPVDQQQHSKAVELMLEVLHSPELLKQLKTESSSERIWDWMRTFEEGKRHV